MYLEKFDNNGTPYLRVVEGIRATRDDGRKTIKKKIIFNVGALSKFDDHQPNYYERLKTSFKNGVPLIDSLLPYCNNNRPFDVYKFSISEFSPDCVGHPKLYSHSLIEQILDELGVISVLNSYKGFSKIKYDLVGFVRLLIYGRILSPASKMATIQQNSDYFEDILDKDFYKYNIYDSLDFVLQHKKQLISRINTTLTKVGERSADIIFYDVTNFFFETDEPDDDILDEDGELIEKGIRKMGVSKEERTLPIVQMGMFVDKKGYPISLEIFPGNTLDHLTVQDSLIKNLDGIINSRYIFIGDRGMCNYVNLLHLVNNGKGFIVSKSIKKSTKNEQDWIRCPDDYIKVNDHFKYKSKVTTVKFKVRCKDNDNKKFKEESLTFKTISYFSKKFYDREMNENKSFLEFLEKLETSPSSFRISSAQSRSIRPFLRKEVFDSTTGEILESNKLKMLVDFDKVNEYRSLFGYYQILTSELNMDPIEVIDKYHLLPLEECNFRMLKNALEARPIHVRTRDHIEAHLIICLISLIVIRVIQNKIIDKFGKSETGDWELGMSAERIQKALVRWTVDSLPNNLYRFNNTDDDDLMKIFKAFDFEIPIKLFKKQELRSLKKKLKIFC